ncbi:MAG: methyltransferase domain-containing protein [Gemmatimonadota bacterium]
MRPSLTPARRRGVEILDAPDVPAPLRERSHRDIAVANAVFGGTRVLLAALGACRTTLPRDATFLDVGAGTGEASARARQFCARHGIRLHTIALDVVPHLAAAARRHAADAVCASALQLPLANASVDVVSCTQVAHHFEGEALDTLLRELHRVARHRVIVSDIRRSWLAAAGLWLASYPLGFHAVSRHDGVVSVLRGFTAPELAAMVHAACGERPVVRRHAGFRLTASWTPRPATPVPPPS